LSTDDRPAERITENHYRPIEGKSDWGSQKSPSKPKPAKISPISSG
jgi:hypothetical protein